MLCRHVALAQLYNAGTVTNDGGLISDWENQWFNASTGVFDGLNNGVFEHHGPSSQTFMNDGVYNASGGHIDKFMGPLGTTGAQEIGGSVRPYFFNLELINGAGQLIEITNSDGANVRSLATFSNGITTTIRTAHQLGALRFEDGASYTGGNTDSQHVDGYVSKIGDDAFVFPVGSGTDIRTLEISAPAAATDHYSVAWIAGDPTSTTDPSGTPAQHPIASFATGLQAVSPVGQWDWIAGNTITTEPVTPATGTGEGLNIKVSIPDMTGFAQAGELRLVGWNGSQWMNLSTGTAPYAGNSYASGNTENSILEGTMIAGITAIGIGRTPPLPVKLISFNGKKEGTTSILTWETTEETNSDYFEVQHSINGKKWHAIGTVAATGESSVLKGYRFSHASPVEGENLYRLRMVDRDGTFAYSVIRSLAFDDAVSLEPYPNPVSEKLFFKNYTQLKQVVLYNSSGRQVLAQKQLSGDGIDVRGLQPGLYVVSLTLRDGTVKTCKLGITK